MSPTTTLTDTIYSTIIVERAPTTLQTSTIPLASANVQLRAAAATSDEPSSTKTTHPSSTKAVPSASVSAMASQIAKLQAEKKEWEHLHLALGLTIMALVLLIAFYIGLKVFCCVRKRKQKVVQGGVERVWPGSKKSGGKVGKLAGRVAGFL